MADKLTTKGVEGAEPSEARREIPDALLPGLYLIVQPSGAKSWAVRYRHDGKTRKHTLGPYPRLNLKEARELGGEALRTAAGGDDPAHEKKQARPESVRAAVAQFLDKYCKHNQRLSTRKETARFMSLYVLPAWGNRTIGSISRDDVRTVIDKLVARDTPILANRVFAKIRKFFNWAVEDHLIAASPCAGMKRPIKKERVGDRVLTDDELRLIWQALDKMNGRPFASTVKLLILTGQRRGEVGGLQWSEIDTGKRLWTLPRQRAKNDNRHEIPLSPQAMAVIEQMPRIGDRFVFTTNGIVPATDFAKNKRRLDALLPPDMPNWCLHDLRRTVASGMAGLGVNLPVIEKVLNHVSGTFAGVVSVYQRHDFAAHKRAALNAWGKHVAEIVAP
jgi:integrase